jgi:hypothetical protein
VDFRDDLGVQIVPVEGCKDWSRPQISIDEFHILDMVISSICAQPFTEDDIVEKQSMRYGGVFALPAVARTFPWHITGEPWEAGSSMTGSLPHPWKYVVMSESDPD